MKPIALNYSVRIWISSVLIAPVSFFIVGATQNPIKADDLTGLISMYILLVVFQLVFSILTWLMFWMIIELIAGLFEGAVLRKFFISIIGAGLTVATFYLFPFFGEDGLTGGLGLLLLSNCCCISIGSWYFKLPQSVQTPTIQCEDTPSNSESFYDARSN